MAGNAAHARPNETQGLLSIGQVLARLTSEFPDLTPSKLRFLEDRQLINPARTESGYRKFSPADLERLRFVLTVQRDHYLPLKVIRGLLADLDAGKQPDLPGGPVTGTIPTMLSTERRLSREELIRETGATPQLLNDAVSASLIAPAEWFNDDTVAVLGALVALQRSGIEPRHLRGYRTAAERELGLIESAVSPLLRRNDASSRARAHDVARDLATQFDIVRSSLTRAALSRLTK